MSFPVARQVCTGHAEYRALLASPAFDVRWRLEHQLAGHVASPPAATLLQRAIGRPPDKATALRVAGVCAVCRQAVDFHVDLGGAWRSPEGFLIPNWRETMRCPACGMNARQRAVCALIDAWTREVGNAPSAYLMEQVSPLYRWATETHPGIRWTGSEYLGPGHAGGVTVDDLRHEDAERLSFPADSFDLLVSCDVFEHVPDPERAFREVARVLRPASEALLTFPMDLDRETNERRAIRDGGEIRHLAPPSYHGNPLSPEGSLVFTIFGWEALDQLRAAGLADVRLEIYWSYELGYLGVQFVVRGRKP